MGAAARARIESEFPARDTLAALGRILETDARRARQGAPRVPSALARASAFEAIELTRLQRLSNDLWTTVASRPGRRVYGAIAKRLEPAYRLVVATGWRWVPAMRARARSIFLDET
jgi:hypothetical protein